jgi:hypothetical protein
MLGTMAELGTDIACFWALHNFYPPRGGDFGYLSSEGNNTPRYSYYVFPLLRRHLSGEICAVKTSDATVSAYASREGKKLSVVLINKTRRGPTTAQIWMQKFDPQRRAKVWVLDEKRKYRQIEDRTDVSSAFQLSLSPFSIVALEMIAQDSIVPPQNLARFAVATASSYSTIGPHFKPSSAIDGIPDTRWNSAAWTKSNGEEAQWFQLSWKSLQRIRQVKIMWGETYAVDYILKASSDGKSWRTILAVTKGKGGTEEHTVDSTMARYLRIEGKKGAKGISAYSVREIEVFGE